MGSYSRDKMVSVFIPAHNEQEIIIETLKSIFSQTLKPTQVIVICDNCTDNTILLINEFKNTTKANVKIFQTKNNTGRKAGALNQAFNKLKLKNYVLIMDADTLIDKNALKYGMDMIIKDKKLAAVCSRAGVLPYTGKSLWKKTIWTIQHIEYGQFDSHRIETKGKIKVAHGMATLFRVNALKTVPLYRKKILDIDSNIYLENNLVEDYEMTLCLKNNWKISSCMNMLAWTDVPVSVKELWIQRLRWLRGGVDTLRLHSWNRVTLFEILNHWLFVLLVILQILAYAFSIYYLSIFGFQKFNIPILLVCSLAYIDSVYRLKYVQNKTFFDYIIKMLILPEIIYAWFQAIALMLSYILSFCNIKQRW